MASTGLETYISNAYFGDNHSLTRERIFDRGITHRSPLLRSDSVNRILVYPGSFNPPHLGHFELLRHGVRESGRDLNIIAAIILPLDDESLENKFEGTANTLIFSKAERAQLWTGYVPSDWYWVFGRSTDDLYDFQDCLTDAITQDGFQLEWVALCGPDYVQVNRSPVSRPWGCDNVIVSDVGRPADFTSRAINSLKTLKGCAPWSEDTPDLDALYRSAQESTSWFYSGLFILCQSHAQSMLDEDPNCVQRMANETSDSAVEESKAVRVCRRSDRPACTIRFIPMKSTMEDMSSTRIRGVIQRHTRSKYLAKELQELVLYPELLVEMLKERIGHDNVGLSHSQ